MVCGFSLFCCCCSMTNQSMYQGDFITCPRVVVVVCKNCSSSLVSGHQFVKLTSNLYPENNNTVQWCLKSCSSDDSLSSFNIKLERFIQEWFSHPPTTRWVRKNANSLHLSAQEEIGVYYYDLEKVKYCVFPGRQQPNPCTPRDASSWSYMAININFITIRC